LCRRINPGDLNALDKILKFNLEAPGAGIQSKIMHLINETEYDCLFVDNNVIRGASCLCTAARR
jgi:hypothetical protein